jgi:hypothetical protein
MLGIACQINTQSDDDDNNFEVETYLAVLVWFVFLIKIVLTQG